METLFYKQQDQKRVFIKKKYQLTLIFYKNGFIK